MGNFLYFMMSVNDPDNGNDTGKAAHFCFDIPAGEIALDLEGWSIVCRREGDQIRVSRRKFPIQSYGTWVGNWCWDAAVVDMATAVEIANYLLSLGKFDCIQGLTDAFDAWHEGKPITAEMLA